MHARKNVLGIYMHYGETCTFILFLERPTEKNCNEYLTGLDSSFSALLPRW